MCSSDFQKRLEELDASHGTDDTVLADGWVNQTIELRKSQEIGRASCRERV